MRPSGAAARFQLGLWWLKRARFYHGRCSVLGQQIIQLCKTCFCAFYQFLGGVDPTGAYIFSCAHLARLQKLKLLLDACLLLLAPGNETIGCSPRRAPRIVSVIRATLILAAELPLTREPMSAFGT